MQYASMFALYSFVLAGTAFTLFHLLEPDLDMYFSRRIVLLIFASIGHAKETEVDLGWYAPKKSWINDLKQVINGSGTNGFEFGGSQLPVGIPYGTYNWCNMPHVREQEYSKVNDDYELIYVEV